VRGQIPTGGATTLVVGWRSGTHVRGRVVRFGGEVRDELQQAATQTVEIIDNGNGKRYDPDDEQNDAPYLTVERDELFDTEVLEVLSTGASLQEATEEELKRRRNVFYALLWGNSVDNRTAFIKAGNPIKLAQKSLFGFLDNSLQKISYPLFGISPDFDIVLTADGVWTLSQPAFERLFKDTQVVAGKITQWVDELSNHLPIADESKSTFATSMKTNTYLRRKVQSLLQKDYLQTLTPETLRKIMLTRGLDPDVLMPEGELVLNKDNQKDVLNLLNDDLFTGDFSGTQYAACRKERRG
jgi:hypothetical protein